MRVPQLWGPLLNPMGNLNQVHVYRRLVLKRSISRDQTYPQAHV